MRERIVLIGEDDDAIADALADAIGDEPGFRAVVMSDGTFALDTARRIRPDALVLDIMLPGMNGFEVYDELRADRATEHLPVLFMTADRETFAREFRDRGITDVLSKPFDLGAMLRRLRALIDVADEETEERDTAPA